MTNILILPRAGMVRRLAFVGKILAAAFITLPTVDSAQAGVVIGSTRVIYPADQKDVSIWFQSRNTKPALVQVWLDDGDESIAPEKANVPFIATPPIFRIEPEKQQVVRLVYTGEPLPKDKESLFWLNMLEVPPKLQDKGAANQLQLAFRTRLKVFFRPSNLPYEANQAPQKLSWQVVADKNGFALKVTNPTFYNVSFDTVTLVSAGKRHEKPVGQSSADNMVGPGTQVLFPLPSLKTKPGNDAQVEFESIDDIGSKVSHTSRLSS